MIGFKSSDQDITKVKGTDLHVTTKHPTLKTKVGQDPRHHDNLKFRFASDYAAGTYNLYTIPHRFGYVPAHYARLSFDGETYDLLPLTYDIGPGTSKIVRSYADENNFYIDFVRNGVGTATTGVTLYITYTITTEPGA